MFLFVAFALLHVAVANPVIPKDVAVQQISASGHFYGLDFSQVATVSQMSCIKQNGYSVVFVRGYSPVGSGSFDNNAVNNIQNAYSAGVGTEVYMTPQPKSSKSGVAQLDEMYNGLRNRGITVRSVWIQVTSPVNWSSSVSSNVNFIKSIISRATFYSMTVGIYTNSHEWKQITNNWTGASDVMLWYWNVFGSGLGGESAPNFSDFSAFGGFRNPSVKQFGQTEAVCGISPVNRDVFLNSNIKMEDVATLEKAPIVGGYIRI